MCWIWQCGFWSYVSGKTDRQADILFYKKIFCTHTREEVINFAVVVMVQIQHNKPYRKNKTKPMNATLKNCSLRTYHRAQLTYTARHGIVLVYYSINFQSDNHNTICTSHESKQNGLNCRVLQTGQSFGICATVHTHTKLLQSQTPTFQFVVTFVKQCRYLQNNMCAGP